MLLCSQLPYRNKLMLLWKKLTLKENYLNIDYIEITALKIKVNNQIYYIKDLRVFKNISLDDIVIIDNSVLSF